MDIKLKLNEVLNINQVLKAIIDDTTTKVEPLFKFRLLGIMKALEPSVQNFEIIRNEKIAEYGEQSEDGRVSISQDDTEAIKKFNNDLMSVIQSDVTINIEKLKASDIFDKGVKAEYLMGLFPIIEE